nr:MAG TPA: hypothetical protein [Caudoviricetes sp.]
MAKPFSNLHQIIINLLNFVMTVISTLFSRL